jgi:anti-sigma regulatory factor (Ser/Thr protein kinase)
VLRFPPVVASAASARHFVRDCIDEWGLSVSAEETMVLVSEAVTNVVQHVRSEVTVTVSARGDGLRIEVSDDSPVTPRMAALRPYSETGRGMFLIDALASCWGVDSRNCPDDTQGKTVWFEMHPTTAVR